jgi:hypothetical protein
LLLFTAGCQSVQGIDLNAMLGHSRHALSAEGAVTHEFVMDLNEEEIGDTGFFACG